MKIVWDEPKRLANINKHGVDFAEIDGEFFLASAIRTARPGRFMAVGWSESGMVTVIFARLGTEGLSIISMRPASVAERKWFDAKT